MNRRRFLTMTSLSLGTAGAAIAVGGANGAAANHSGRAEKVLEEALKRAKAIGKPLILVPGPKEADGSQVELATWGRLFSSPSDEHLSLLSLFEFVFAEVPGGAVFDESAHCALYRTKADEKWQAIPLAEGHRSHPDTLFRSIKETLVKDAEQVGELVKASLGGDMFRDTMMRVLGASPGMTPRLKISEADGGAASLYQRIEGSESEAVRRWGRSLLAAAVSVRLYEEDPLGAHWESRYPDVDPCPPCGMAVLPKESRLFLDAYTMGGR